MQRLIEFGTGRGVVGARQHGEKFQIFLWMNTDASAPKERHSYDDPEAVVMEFLTWGRMAEVFRVLALTDPAPRYPEWREVSGFKVEVRYASPSTLAQENPHV